MAHRKLSPRSCLAYDAQNVSRRDEVVAIADTASLIGEGRIVQTGNPQTVCDHYAHCCRPCSQAERVEAEAMYHKGGCHRGVSESIG